MFALYDSNGKYVRTCSTPAFAVMFLQHNEGGYVRQLSVTESIRMYFTRLFNKGA
jgi:hypothetical protein